MYGMTAVVLPIHWNARRLADVDGWPVSEVLNSRFPEGLGEESCSRMAEAELRQGNYWQGRSGIIWSKE